MSLITRDFPSTECHRPLAPSTADQNKEVQRKQDWLCPRHRTLSNESSGVGWGGEAVIVLRGGMLDKGARESESELGLSV